MIRSDVLGPNQACTLFGATGGSQIVPGRDYIEAGFQYNTADLWRRNFLVLVGLFFFFQFTQIICMEFFPVSINIGSTIRARVLTEYLEILRSWWCQCLRKGRRRCEEA